MQPIKVIVKLVEDNIADVLAVQNALSYNPLYDLECFLKADQFITSLNKDIDIVITDLRMDNYDPLQTIRDIHQNYPGIRILVISAVFTDQIYKDLFWYRVDGIIEKNGGNWPGELLRWIDHLTPNILEQKKLQQL